MRISAMREMTDWGSYRGAAVTFRSNSRHNSDYWRRKARMRAGLFNRSLKVLPYLLASGVALAGARLAYADPVTATAPASPLNSAKDDVAAAVRAADGDHALPDSLEVDPVPDANAAAKAAADRRAALAALGMQPLQAQPQQQKQKQGPSNQAQGRVQNQELGGDGPVAAAPRDKVNGADFDVTQALKASVKPVYDDLSKTGINEAVRNLKADLKAELASDKEHLADAGPTGEGSASEGGKPVKDGGGSAEAGGAAWQASVADAGLPQRSAAQIKQDQIVAAAFKERLIEEIKPWALGAVVLLVLALVARFVMGYLRKLEQRRQRRRFKHSTNPQHRFKHSTNPRRT
jgi:hypothetical protein